MTSIHKSKSIDSSVLTGRSLGHSSAASDVAWRSCIWLQTRSFNRSNRQWIVDNRSSADEPIIDRALDGETAKGAHGFVNDFNAALQSALDDPNNKSGERELEATGFDRSSGTRTTSSGPVIASKTISCRAGASVARLVRRSIDASALSNNPIPSTNRIHRTLLRDDFLRSSGIDRIDRATRDACRAHWKNVQHVERDRL